jgi:hypothetical protein
MRTSRLTLKTWIKLHVLDLSMERQMRSAIVRLKIKSLRVCSFTTYSKLIRKFEEKNFSINYRVSRSINIRG